MTVSIYPLTHAKTVRLLAKMDLELKSHVKSFIAELDRLIKSGEGEALIQIAERLHGEIGNMMVAPITTEAGIAARNAVWETCCEILRMHKGQISCGKWSSPEVMVASHRL